MSESSVVIERHEEYIRAAVAVPPRRRDFFRVLLGRYEPKVIERRTITAAGYSKILRDTYTAEAFERSLSAH